MRHKIKVSMVIVIGSVLLAFLPRATAAEPAFSVGFIQGSTTAVPVSIIKRLELDKKHGLNMETKQFGDPDSINDAFVLKRLTFQPGLDVLVGGNNKIKSGYGLAIFPTFKATNKLVVRADSPLRSVAELRGKRIAVMSTGGEFLVLKWIMRTEHGIDLLKDVDPRSVPPPVALQLLTQGEVAAALVFEPAVSRALFGGKGRVLWDIQQEWQKRKGQPLWFSAIHVDDSFARTYPDTVKRYLRAYSEAVDYINKNPAATYQSYKDSFKITDEADFQLLLKNLSDILTTKWDDKVIGSIKEYMRIAVEEKLMPRVADELFSKDFAP